MNQSITKCCEKCRTIIDRDYTYTGQDKEGCYDFKDCSCHSPSTGMSWKAEFDKQFETFPVEGEHSQFSEGVFVSDVDRLKDFIAKLLSQQKEEMERKAIETGKKLYDMRRLEPGKDDYEHEYLIGWNKALDIASRAVIDDLFDNTLSDAINSIEK